MTIYEKNLKTLAEYYPQMDTLIETARRELEPELEIVEEISDEEDLILKIKKDGRSCYLSGKRNTKEPAEMWVQSLGDLQMNAPIFLMGVGNWMYLQELVEQTSKRLAIIVYEPSLQIFVKFLETIEIRKWMEKHLIVFWVKGLEGMDEKHMECMLESILKYEMLPWFRYLIVPNYDVLFAEEALEFIRVCCNIANEEAANYVTQKLFSNVMVKNLYANAFYLCDGYKTTQLPKVIPGDVPGIIVAAGPSLNKNIKELKKAKGKAFIVAVDTAIKPLIKEGIIPDMFVIIDALKPLDLIKVEEARNIPLVTTLNAASEVLEYHTGMKIFFNEGYQFAERIFLKTKQPFGDVPTGGSVATTTFGLLNRIGLQTIILVGQDLAYTNNKTHADGTFQEVMEEKDTSKLRMVEGNYEEKVPTGEDLKIFLDWYDMYIEGCKEHRKNFRVINATEGGAKIKNTEIMTLKEAIERECNKEVDIQKNLRELPPMLDEEGRKWALEYLNGMPDEFQKLELEARKIQKTYQKLDKICNKKNMDSKEYLSILKKLKKQIKNIEKTSTYQLAAITLSDAKYILRNEQFLQEDSIQAEGREIARKGILYMDNIENCARVFKEYAESVIEEKKK